MEHIEIIIYRQWCISNNLNPTNHENINKFYKAINKKI